MKDQPDTVDKFVIGGAFAALLMFLLGLMTGIVIGYRHGEAPKEATKSGLPEGAGEPSVLEQRQRSPDPE